MTSSTAGTTTGPDTEQDVVDVLTTDHHDVLDLIDSIAHVSGDEQRRDTADTVIAEIIRHSVAEEMYVYPAMRDHLPDGDQQVRHDIEEHQELEKTLKRLESADAGDPQFAVVLGQVRTQLQHHATDEDTTQFPLLRQHLSRGKLVELAGQVENAKKLAPTRPHPASPHAELFHKTLGAGVGLVDKLRDAITGRSDNT